MFFWNSLAFPMIQPDVGNLISGSSVFSKSSLNTWKFTVHLPLKPGLENFEHYFTSVCHEATVRTGHRTTHWFQTGKGVHQGYILSPCLFNFCAEYIMQNAVLEEAQAGIKTARRNINNLRYEEAC